MNMLRAEIPALALTALETHAGVSEILSLDRRFGGEPVTRFLDMLDEGLFQSAATIFGTGTFTLDRNQRLSQALDRIAALYRVEFVRPAWNIQWPIASVDPPGTTGASKFCVGRVVAVAPDANARCGSARAGQVKKGDIVCIPCPEEKPKGQKNECADEYNCVFRGSVVSGICEIGVEIGDKKNSRKCPKGKGEEGEEEGAGIELKPPAGDKLEDFGFVCKAP